MSANEVVDFQLLLSFLFMKGGNWVASNLTKFVVTVN